MSLKDYIQGNRRGKAANRLEREAMNDPFLEEALEGFETVAGDHAAIVDRLEKKFSKPAFTSKKSKNAYLYWSIAASVMLLIGLGNYLFLKNDKHGIPVYAELQPAENESMIFADSPALLLAQTEKLQKEMTTSANTTSKSISSPASSSTVPDADISIDGHLSDIAPVAEYRSDQSESEITAESSVNLTAKEITARTYRGKVVDESGEPLIGVSVVEKGSTNGTTTDITGAFALQLSTDDSLKLVASYLGYESKEITTSSENQILTLKPDNNSLSEVVTVAFGAQKKSNRTGSVSNVPVSEKKAVEVKTGDNNSIQTPFGEKEFQTYCRQKADKNVCNGKGAAINVSFFIDETGKPAKIEYKKYSCDEARNEMDALFASSPVWTKSNRKVTLTIKW